ncbi:YraN family protein [Stenotrophomonas sp. YAU14D1_LEIMI4_1]|uniref:YraN family protein n=1 Tax=Stenotrophomonas sp. YAU14D1_LEIMI4_1 TaxID=2072407 RepID=UPI001900FF83|nr:YraN family protein [Stenotrophomonas sp. YAU14D1_LEIMI4_1]
MVAEHLQRGSAVEAAAELHLQQAGLQRRARNVRYRGGELDLVMEDAGTVVFVEVRYRARSDFGSGAASIDARKCRRLAHAAQLYLQDHPTLANAPCRFDVVEATGEPPQLSWLRDAFRLDDC